MTEQPPFLSLGLMVMCLARCSSFRVLMASSCSLLKLLWTRLRGAYRMSSFTFSMISLWSVNQCGSFELQCAPHFVPISNVFIDWRFSCHVRKNWTTCFLVRNFFWRTRYVITLCSESVYGKTKKNRIARPRSIEHKGDVSPVSWIGIIWQYISLILILIWLWKQITP